MLLSSFAAATGTFEGEQGGRAEGVFVPTVIGSRLVGGGVEVVLQQAFGLGRQATGLVGVGGGFAVVADVALVPLSVVRGLATLGGIHELRHLALLLLSLLAGDAVLDLLHALDAVVDLVAELVL